MTIENQSIDPSSSNPVTTIPLTPTPPLTDPNVLKSILIEKLKRIVGIKGEIYLPCLPSVQDEYMKLLTNLLGVLGQSTSTEQAEKLQELLARCLAEGYRLSPHSRVVISFFPANAQHGLASGITFNAQVQTETVADKYQTWPQIRPEPLFGSHPDTKVLHIAAALGDPTKVKILDVGAGTGRNSLPLARLGHPVDAVEMTPVFTEKLTAAAEAENLPLKVIKGDILDPLLRVGAARYKLVISTEVLSHFRQAEQVRLFLAKMADSLVVGGMILVSTFIAIDGYEPDQMARQMSEFSWCSLFTRNDIKEAMEDLPLELVSDERVIEYEQANLPAEAWPPTSWYLGWASGRDLFPIEQNPPIELRWLLFKRI